MVLLLGAGWVTGANGVLSARGAPGSPGSLIEAQGALGSGLPSSLPSCSTQMVAGSPMCGGAQLVYDAADGYVLAQMICINRTSPTLFDSCTWEYEGGSWSQLTSSTGSRPPPLLAAGFAWDAADGYAVLFGGITYPTGHPMGSTWTFRAGTWTNLTTAPIVTGRLPFAFVQAVYDSSDPQVLATYQTTLDLNGTNGSFVTYFYSYRAGTWTNLSATSPPPSALAYRPYLADDPSDHGVLFYGGYSNGSSLLAVNSSWLYANGAWSPVTGSPAPPVLYGPSITYDTVDGYVLLVGGSTQSCDANPCTFSRDVWTFADGQWRNVTSQTRGSVPREAGGAMATDGATGTVLEGFGLVGYTSSSPFPLAITQANLYSYVAGTWTQIPNPSSSSGLPLAWVLLGTLLAAGAAAVAAMLVRRRRRTRAP